MRNNLLSRLSVRLLAGLMVFLLLPAAALCEGAAEVTEIEILPTEAAAPKEPLLPLDFSPGSVPSEKNVTVSTDENGNPVQVYEDSTIRVVISEDTWMKTGIWMADVTVADASQLRTVSQGNGDFSNKNARGKALSLAKHMNAVVALNGDSWGASEKNGYGVVLRQGNLIASRLDNNGKHLMDLLLIDANGDFHGVHAAAEGDLDDPTSVGGVPVVNIFSFGPILVENGEKITDFQGTDRESRAGGTWMNMRTDDFSQRVALCQVGPLHYKVITCAGHRSGHRGLTLPEFTDYLVTQDVQFAYNLDGGESTMLYFFNTGKINLKNTEMRELWDIIYFASAE